MLTTELARLYLVRHARTSLNAEGRLRGRLDPPLDEVGRREAAAVAAVLAAFAPSRIVSSPLRRAVQTAEAIACRAGVPVVIDVRLADRDYGPWAGSSEADVVAENGSIDLAPGVESVASVVDRARAALDAQAEYLESGAVVMVSHDAVNRLLLTTLDTALARSRSLDQATACWNAVARADGRWLVERVNEQVK